MGEFTREGMSMARPLLDLQIHQMVRPRQRSGFALLDRELVVALAKKGSKIAHELGKANHWTSEQAKVVGKRGNETQAKQRALNKAATKRKAK